MKSCDFKNILKQESFNIGIDLSDKQLEKFELYKNL
mgnify:FL=1